MPDVSQKQHNFMEGIAHGMTPRGGKGPSPGVAREFIAADKAEGKFTSDPHHHKARASGFKPEPRE
jgi:hypothetical protein